MKKYLIPSFLISVVLLLSFYFLNDLLFKGLLHDQFDVMVIIFFLQSLPVAWLMHTGQQDPTQFPVLALGAIGFRMMTSLMVLTVFYVLKIPELVALFVQFSILYFVYLVFELIVVLANLRRN